MTRKSNRPAGGLNAGLKWSGVALAVLAILSVTLYASTPFLVARIAPALAVRFGLKELQLEIGYPQWRGIDIARVVAVTDAMEIRGRQARMEYDWHGLRAGRIAALTFDELEIRLPSATAGDNTAEPPAVDTLFPENPVQQLNIKKLVLVFPDTGFVGAGQAQMGDGLLSLSLDGVEPELASRLSIRADLSRDGVFHARLGEHDKSAGDILKIDGLIGSDKIGLGGIVSLNGYPLQLASELAGLPAGTGEVSARFQTELPWPLPNTTDWPELVATVPAFSVDWQSGSDDLSLTLRGISGSARLNRGDIEASVGGAVLYQSGQREITAQLPADYQLQYQQGTLSGAAGPRLTVKDAAIEATATVQHFSLRDQPAIYLAIDANIDAHLDTLHSTGGIGATLDGNTLTLEGNLNLKNAPQQSKGKPVSLTKGAGTLQGRIETRLPSPLPGTLAWEDLTATIPSFAIGWKSANNDLKLTAISGSAQLNQGDLIASVSGAIRYRLSGHNIDVQIPKDYRLSFRDQTLTGGDGLRLTLTEDKTGIVARLRSFSLHTAAKQRLEIDAGIDAKVDTMSSAGRLTAQVNVDDAAGNLASGRLNYTGFVNMAGQQHDGDLSTTFKTRGEVLTATGTLNSGLFETVPLTLDYNLGSGVGYLLAKHRFDFRQSITKRLIPGWKEVYDLDAGRIEAELRLNWRTFETIAAHLSAKLTAGRAHYEDYLATGISGHLNLRTNDSSNTEDWWLEPAVLRIDRVDVGIPVDNLVFEVAWYGDEVRIRNASATVLGGLATTAPVVYTISTGSAAFAMLLKDVDLATVLALEGDDVTGTGKLSGSLPVVIMDNSPRIEGGVLTAASPGGFLRLTPTLAVPAGQQNLTFALTALQDFTYSELTTQIDYAETGDLTLAVRLKGRNPAVEKGRPILYNLNVNENVPVLLESLRLQDKLTEGLEKKLKK